MRDVEERAAEGDEAARLALRVFCHRARKYVGAYAAVLGGLDALVFTAGIGEKSPDVRKNICDRLTWLGIALDDEANARNATQISRQGTRPVVYVIPTDEERMIVSDTLAVVGTPAVAEPASLVPAE